MTACVITMTTLLPASAGPGDTALNQATEAYADGDREEAITYLTEAIRLDPKDARAYGFRGTLFTIKGDHDRAIADYSEVIRLVPEDTSIYYYRGGVYKAKRDYGKALADFTESVRLNPKDEASYFEAAWLLATCPKSEIRDGKKAVEYATKGWGFPAGKKNGNQKILAAAYAEAGVFAKAVFWEKKYLDTLKVDDKHIKESCQRLARYEAHKQYHEDK